MEIIPNKIDSYSWETICQNVVETIGIVLEADIAIICAQESLNQKQQCFCYQANLDKVCELNDEYPEKNAQFNNKLVILKDSAEQTLRNTKISQQGQACQNCPISMPQLSQPASAQILSSLECIREQNPSTILSLLDSSQTREFRSPQVQSIENKQDLPRQNKYDLNSPFYNVCQKLNVRSSLSIPLSDQGNLKATLTLHRCQPESNWQPQEIKLAHMMAAQAGLAIAQVEAYEKMRNLAQREATLNRITNAIRSSLEPQVMFNAIVTELGSALKVDGCSLSLWTKKDRFMRCVAFYNPHEPNSSKSQNSTISLVQIADNPVLQKLLHELKPLVFQDLAAKRELARHDLPWRAKSKALLIVPLMLNGEITGSLTLRQSTLSRKWEQSEIQLAQAVANQAAIALKQARLYDTTRKQAKQLKLSQQKNCQIK